MKTVLIWLVTTCCAAACGEGAVVPTVIKGHHVGESFREYLAAEQSHDISDCDALLADPETGKELQKITKRTGHNFESMTSEDETPLIVKSVILPSGKSELLAFQLDRCRNIRARLDKPLTFKDETSRWAFVDGKLADMFFHFGTKDYLGRPIGPDVSFADVVGDFTARFGEPKRRVDMFQNGYGATFDLEVAVWTLPDVYITAEEKRPELDKESAFVEIMDRALVDQQQREKLQRPNIVDSKQ